MARNTKRKTKHRGNAAGIVEVRGRTGRKPTAAEKGTTTAGGAAKKAERPNRLDKPPTWSGSFVRAAVAAVIVLALSAALLKGGITHALVLLPVVLIIYVPLGYYTDQWMYNRRMAKRTNGT
jgi:hypothetical protein